MAMELSKTVDAYIAKQGPWQKSVRLLREILLETELQEEVKWGSPVYTLGKKHVVGIWAFKTYAGLWFIQGVFLTDPANKLVNAQESKTQALRQWRFQSEAEIVSHIDLIRSYVLEAIANQKAGKEILPNRQKPLNIPPELKVLLQRDPALAEAFAALNLTQKREFAEYIQLAKRAETKVSRLEKIQPMILQGVGLNDMYR